MQKEQILTFLDALRDSDYYMQYIFTRGGCFQLYKILKTLDSRAIPYINKHKRDHVVSRIGGFMYDINGVVDIGEYMPLPINMLNEVNIWSFSRTQVMGIKECPYCGEAIFVDIRK